MAKAPKMVRLAVDETSGVDHPAHLSEGWLVMKSADAEAIEAVIDSLTEDVVVADNDETETVTKEDSVSDENVKSTEDAVATEANESLEKALARIAELEVELEKAMHGKKKPVKMEDDIEQDEDESEEDYMKRIRSMKKEAPEAVVKALDALEKAVTESKARAEMAEATLKKEREENADKEAVVKAKSWNNLPLEAEKVGPALRRLSVIDEELAKSIESVLNAVNEQAKTSNLFAEIGKAVDSASADAYSRLTALAKAAVDSGTAGSLEQAMADVALANPDLYKQYLTEKGA